MENRKYPSRTEALSITDEMIQRYRLVPDGSLSLSPESLVALMRSQFKIKFKHQGRNPANGFDCIGIVMWCLLMHGEKRWIPVNPANTLRANYGRMPKGHELHEMCVDEFVPIEYSELRVGDFVTMKWGDDKYARHIATISELHDDGAHEIIHTHWGTETVTSHNIEDDWRPRILGCWRLKDWA